MAKAQVPVVLKLFTEADSSLEGTIKSVSETIKAAANSSLRSVKLSTETIVKDVTDSASKGLNSIKVGFISDRDSSAARSAFRSANVASDLLNKSLEQISKRMVNLGEVARGSKLDTAFTLAISKGNDLEAVYQKIAQAARNQAKLALDLARVPQEDQLGVKQKLDAAKLLTRELTREAESIKKAYTSAFTDATKSLRELETQANKKPPTPEKQKINFGASVGAISQIEIDLLAQKNRVAQNLNQSEAIAKKIAEDRLLIERKISDVSNQANKEKLQTGQRNLQDLARAAELTRQQAGVAQQSLQKAVQNQLSAAQSNAPNVANLKAIVAQSRITADNLSADATKAEQAYSRAFRQIKTEADKALKNPGQSGTSGSRLAAGLGIFSPLVNQIGGTIDSIIGSITGRASSFRTTAGIQIGQAISQGIGQGITDGADLTAAGVNKLLSEFTKLELPNKQLIANVGTGIVIACAAGGAALGALAAVSLQTAANFEVLTAKLTTTFKDPTVAVERFNLALEIAAKTPFNVEQVVGAQVQLSALGQRNIDILKRTVDLASGLNADLARTANEVGKAAAGSLRGYQELRNTLGITQERLKLFGGVVDSQNRLLVTNEFQIRKNREALLALIQTDFGGSSQRLSETLSGRVSNLQDAVLKLSGAIGSAYLPTAKSGVEFTTELIDMLNRIPQPFKIAAAGAIATGAALGILTAALAGTSLALGVTGAAISAVAGPAFAPLLRAIPLASTAVAALDLAINTVAIKSIPLLGTSLATAAGPLAVLVAVAGLLNTAFVAQQDEAKRTSDQILAYSKEVAEARRISLQFKEDLTRVFNFPKDFINDSDTAEQKIQKIQEALSKKGALEIAQDLALANVQADTLAEQLSRQEGLLKIQKDRMKEVLALRDRLFTAENLNGNQLTSSVIDIKQFRDAVPGVELFADELLKLRGNADDTKKAIDDFVKLTNGRIGQLSPFVAELTTVTNALADIEKAVDKIQKPLTRLEAPTKFAIKVGDQALIGDALERQLKLQELITAEIENTEGLREKELRGTKFSIEEASKYLTDAQGASKILLEAFIKNNEAITELSNKKFAAQAEQDKFRLQLLEANEKAELSIITKSEQEKRLAIVNSAIEIVKEKAERYRSDLKIYIDVQDVLNQETDKGERFRLQNILDRNKDRIKAEKEAFDFLIEQRKKQQAILGEINAEDYKKLKQQLETFLADTKQVINGIAPTTSATRTFIGIDGKEITTLNTQLNKFWDDQDVKPLSPTQKIKEFTNRLAELKRLEAGTDFGKLGNKGEDAKKAFRDNERELEEGISRAKLEDAKNKARQVIRNEKTGLRETFKDFTLSVDKELSESIGKTQQLNVLESALGKLKSDQVRSHISSNSFRAEEAKLTAKIRDIQIDLNRQVKEQVKDLEKLRQDKLKDEVTTLESRRDSASGAQKAAIESQLKGRRRQVIQAEFLELQAEREAELAEAVKSGKNKELILQKYAEKEQSLVRKAYQEYVKAEQDKLKATQDRFKAIDDELKKFQGERVGGEGSPLISVEELAFRSRLPGFGSDADSRISRESDNFGSPFGGTKIPDFELYKTRFEQENRIKLGKDGKPLPGSFDELKPIPAPNITTTVIIDGKSSGDAELIKDAAKLANKAQKNANKKMSLLSGKDSSAFDLNLSTDLDFGAA